MRKTLIHSPKLLEVSPDPNTWWYLGIQGQSLGVCSKGVLSLVRRHHRESGEGLLKVEGGHAEQSQGENYWTKVQHYLCLGRVPKTQPGRLEEEQTFLALKGLLRIWDFIWGLSEVHGRL